MMVLKNLCKSSTYPLHTIGKATVLVGASLGSSTFGGTCFAVVVEIGSLRWAVNLVGNNLVQVLASSSPLLPVCAAIYDLFFSFTSVLDYFTGCTL